MYLWFKRERRHWLERFHRDEDGQALVFVAITLVTLVFFVALVVNVGHVVTWRVRVQNSVDAAAYSGASVQANSLAILAALNLLLAILYGFILWAFIIAVILTILYIIALSVSWLFGIGAALAAAIQPFMQAAWQLYKYLRKYLPKVMQVLTKIQDAIVQITPFVVYGEVLRIALENDNVYAIPSKYPELKVERETGTPSGRYILHAMSFGLFPDSWGEAIIGSGSGCGDDFTPADDSASATEKECATCEGSGDCQTCGGDGKLACSNCGGDGKVVVGYDGEGEPIEEDCPVCDGRGWFGCTECDQPGTADTPGDGKCPECHGKGKASADKGDALSQSGVDTGSAGQEGQPGSSMNPFGSDIPKPLYLEDPENPVERVHVMGYLDWDSPGRRAVLLDSEFRGPYPWSYFGVASAEPFCKEEIVCYNNLYEMGWYSRLIPFDTDAIPLLGSQLGGGATDAFGGFGLDLIKH